MDPRIPTELDGAARIEVVATIGEAALRTEHLICAGRIVFFSALWIRYPFATEVTLGRTLTMSPVALGIVFSAIVLAFVRKPPRSSAFWLATVSVDAAAVTFALADNALWPFPGYSGILSLGDTAGILLSAVSAGFRLSRSAAVWGGVANGAGLAWLLWLDSSISGFDPFAGPGPLFLIYLGGATILAYILATVTRGLVLRAATVALRAERAERGLGSVLADCHDARSALASARLNAELLDRTGHDAVLPETNAEPTRNLLEDLDLVERLVLDVKTRALSDLGSMKQPEPVRIRHAVERVEHQIRLRFPDVELELYDWPQDAQALVAGGEESLVRVLSNLLTNACEGDGHRGASRVSLSVREASGHVELTVADDGPGLGEERGGAKPGGLGVGLHVVRGIVEASSGQLAKRSSPGPGALVSVVFPAP